MSILPVDSQLASGVESSGTATTMVLTLGAGKSVAAGDTVMVTACLRGTAGTRNLTGVTDSKGNTYTVARSDLAFVNASIAKAYITTPLVAGDTITLTASGTVNRTVATASVFSGLDNVAVDKTAVGAATSNSPATAATSTTAQADELLIGVTSVNWGNTTPTDDFTAGSGYTKLTWIGTGAMVTTVACFPEYKIVAATGTYVADGTIVTSRAWTAAIATFKGGTTAHPRSFATIIN